MPGCLSCVRMASIDTLATDYRTITEACGLLDRSERGKLALTGADARSFGERCVWTLIVGVVFAFKVYQDFAMPDLGPTVLGLMGISSATYVGFKMKP